MGSGWADQHGGGFQTYTYTTTTTTTKKKPEKIVRVPAMRAEEV